MKQCMDVEAVTARLKRIEGQVRGIIKMIEEDKPCEDILIQIGSAKAALHKTGRWYSKGTCTIVYSTAYGTATSTKSSISFPRQSSNFQESYREIS